MLFVDVDNTIPSVTCFGDSDGALAVNYNFGDLINDVGNTPLTWSDNVADPSSFVASV